MDTLKKYWYFPVAVITVGVLIWALWQIPRWQAQSYRSRIEPHIQIPQDRIQLEKDFDAIENASRTTLAQIIGGIVVLLGLYVTYQNLKVARQNAEAALRNVNVAEEGKLTDRFSKAVEMMGSEKLEVRLGGIYALERIARDSQKDHWTVMEVFTAFVRENSHKKLDGKETINGNIETKQTTERLNETRREDIQAIMTAIGRRKWKDTETHRLNLEKVNLSNFDLSKADLENAYLFKAVLSEANLHKTELSGAYLREANLMKAYLYGAKLVKAVLLLADLRKVNLNEANLSEARFFAADLTEADLMGANLTKADFRGANLFSTYLSYSKFLSFEQIINAENI